MKNNVYIKKGIPGIVEQTSALGEDYATGHTYEDYMNGAWVELSQAQIAFRNAHPGATPKEIIEMRLTPPPERTLAQAQAEKLSEIDAYDSGEVNRFYIRMGGHEIGLWFDAPQRATFQTSIGSRRRLIAAGAPIEATIQLPVAGQVVSLSLDRAELMLAELQLYADNAYIITETHRTRVSALETVAQVDAYDHTAGYPERLTNELDS